MLGPLRSTQRTPDVDGTDVNVLNASYIGQPYHGEVSSKYGESYVIVVARRQRRLTPSSRCHIRRSSASSSQLPHACRQQHVRPHRLLAPRRLRCPAPRVSATADAITELEPLRQPRARPSFLSLHPSPRIAARSLGRRRRHLATRPCLLLSICSCAQSSHFPPHTEFRLSLRLGRLLLLAR